MAGSLTRRQPRGFTLLEVLVAIAIFAIIGLGANEMLRTITRTHDRARQITDRIGQLSMAFVMMERDLTEIVPRGIRDQYGDPSPALVIGGDQNLIEFTRDGWNNPTGRPRSDMQRVSYQLDDKGELERSIWMVLDRAQDSKPVTQTLLSDVKDVRVNAILDNGTSVNSWPQSKSPDQLPAAVEIIINTKSMGELRRVFALVQNPAPPKQPGGTPGSNQAIPGTPGPRIVNPPGGNQF